VVFLRGAGATTTRWQNIETAMHARGLNTVRDRQHAWNLARAGTPVILVDFSAGSREVTVGRVKARWTTTATTRPLAQLLPRAERERLAAEGATWLDTPVTTEDRQADLPLADPGTTTRLPNQSIDPDQLAKAVITQLH
jgi:hypothetical protein